ncbi:MAG: hypothetical protein KDD33_10135 [Bdellovibrionales bacterium]|nr:hypothetical protein [Bdellovibrionales bacterium]
MAENPWRVVAKSSMGLQNLGMRLFLMILLFCQVAGAQYEKYEAYQTFSDLERYERDYGLAFLVSGVSYLIDEKNQVSGTSVNDRSRLVTLMDLKLSYIFRGGFYFGILFGSESQNINRGGPKTSRESLGFSFGYVRYGWTFLGSWLAHSVQKVEGATDVSEYAKGSGFQLDLAYHWRLNSYFSLGPQLSYKSITYREAESATGAVDADADSTHNILVPMVSLIINLYRG